MSDIEIFAKRFNYAMQLRGYKQKEIVKGTGIPAGTISNYLKGKYDPKIDKLQLIAKFLNVDCAWLMGFEVPMESNKIEVLNENETHILVSSFEKLSQDDKEFVLNMINKLSKK